MALAALKQTPAWAAYEQARTEVWQASARYEARYVIRTSGGFLTTKPGGDEQDRLRLILKHLNQVREAARKAVEALPEFTALGENAWEQLGW